VNVHVHPRPGRAHAGGVRGVPGRGLGARDSDQGSGIRSRICATGNTGNNPESRVPSPDLPSPADQLSIRSELSLGTAFDEMLDALEL
jgi:hypothetical protein